VSLAASHKNKPADGEMWMQSSGLLTEDR